MYLNPIIDLIRESKDCVSEKVQCIMGCEETLVSSVQNSHAIFLLPFQYYERFKTQITLDSLSYCKAHNIAIKEKYRKSFCELTQRKRNKVSLVVMYTSMSQPYIIKCD